MQIGLRGSYSDEKCLDLESKYLNKQIFQNAFNMFLRYKMKQNSGAHFTLLVFQVLPQHSPGQRTAMKEFGKNVVKLCNCSW